MNDRTVLNHIEELIEAEQHLYSKSHITDEEKSKLASMQVELDQYWDLLRQRRALRDAGENPDSAKLRSPDVVEGYEQ